MAKTKALKKFTVKRTYHYWYEVDATDERDAVEKVKQMFVGDFKKMSDDGFEVVEKK